MVRNGKEMTAVSTSESLSTEDKIRLAAEIVSAFVSKNRVPTGELPALLQSAFDTLCGLEGDVAEIAPTETKQKPAVPVSRSVQHDYLVCLEDGKKLTMMKRYLRSQYGLSPEEYRRKWKLPPSYPMVAPAYADRRSQFAKSIGLGTGVRRKSTRAA